MQVEVFGCFGLQSFKNVEATFPSPLAVSALQNLAKKNQQEIQNFHDRICSYMIAKAIDGSITKTSLNKLGLHRR